MFVSQATDFDGNITIADPEDPERTLVIPASVGQETRVAQIATFFGADLSLPATIPMDQVMVFLAATDQQASVDAYVESLGPVALAKYRSAVQFVPASPFGEVVRAALLPTSDSPDADFADLCRAMAATTYDGYAAAEPAQLATIAKFSAAVDVGK